MINTGIRTLNRPDLSWYQRQRHSKLVKQQESKKYLYGLQEFPHNSGLDAFLFENPDLSDATMVADFKRWTFGATNSGLLEAVTFDQLCAFTGPSDPRVDYDPTTGEPIGLLLERSSEVAEYLELKQAGTWISQGEGTLVARARWREKRPSAGAVGLIALRSSATPHADFVELWNYESDDNFRMMIVRNGLIEYGLSITETQSGSDLLTMTTSAITYDGAGVIGAANGFSVTETASFTIPTGLDQAIVGLGTDVYLWIEWLAFVPDKLTATQLENITAQP